MHLGRTDEAEEVLSRMEGIMQNSTRLIHFRQYHKVKGQVKLALGQYFSAEKCCLKAMEFNELLKGSSGYHSEAYDLRLMLAEIYTHRGEVQKSLDILEQLRALLLSSDPCY